MGSKTDQSMERFSVGSKRLEHHIKLVCLLMIASMSFPMAFINASQVAAAATKGLTVSPLRTELDIAPGTAESGYLTVKNSSGVEIDIVLKADEFSVINQQYDYAFTEESDVAKWVSFENDEINLKAGESRKVKYEVGVPQSAEPGGRYISLFVSTSSKSLDNGIISEQRIASLLYITVTGDVSRVGHLMSLTSPWFITDSGEWSALLQNQGTTHYRSRYNVTFYGPFGQIASKTKTGEALILPGTVRLVTSNFTMPVLPGVYKVVFVIGLGDTPAEIAVRYLLFLPRWSVMLAVILAATLTALKVRKTRSKKN